MAITNLLKKPPVMFFLIFLVFFTGLYFLSITYSAGTIASYSLLLRQLSIIAGLLFAASLLIPSESAHINKDLLEQEIVRRFVRWKYYKLTFQIPTLVVFLIVLYFGLFGPLNPALNISIVLTWTIWWAAIIFTFVLIGRLWCTACPFAFAGDVAQKIFSLGKRFPRKDNGLKFQIPLFLILTLVFVFFGVLSSPFLTSIFIIVLTLAAVGFAIVFEKRAFCRYICPIGAVTGLYSMASPVELRSKDCETCREHLRKKCFEACPMAEYIGAMNSNFNCNFCMDCVKACPKDNIALRLRGFGQDLWSKNLGIAGAISAMLILGVSVIQTVAMTAEWGGFLNMVGSLFRVFDPGSVYLLAFLLIVIAFPLGAYSFFALLSNKVSGSKEAFLKTFSVYGLMFMPLGIAIHLAHNVSHLLIEGAQIVPAAAFSLGLTSEKLVAVSPFQNVFWLQTLILFMGYFLTLYIGHKISAEKYKFRSFAPMIAFTILVMLVGLYIFGLPMNPAHIH